MQVERIIVNFNPVFGLRNRRRGLKRFSCFSRKRTDLSKKKLLGVCTLTKVYQYAKEERFLFFEPCRTLVDICMELLLMLHITCHYSFHGQIVPSQIVPINEPLPGGGACSQDPLTFLDFIPCSPLLKPLVPKNDPNNLVKSSPVP